MSEKPVFRILIHRTHMFLGLPDPDPIIRYGSGLCSSSGSGSSSRSWSFCHQAKIIRSYYFHTSFGRFIFEKWCKCTFKKQKFFFWISFLLASWRSMTKIARSGSASGSISQKHGAVDPDPDPHQNVIDLEHWDKLTITFFSRTAQHILHKPPWETF